MNYGYIAALIPMKNPQSDFRFRLVFAIMADDVQVLELRISISSLSNPSYLLREKSLSVIDRNVR